MNDETKVPDCDACGTPTPWRDVWLEGDLLLCSSCWDAEIGVGAAVEQRERALEEKTDAK